jgi:hypothetical protein
VSRTKDDIERPGQSRAEFVALGLGGKVAWDEYPTAERPCRGIRCDDYTMATSGLAEKATDVDCDVIHQRGQ